MDSIPDLRDTMQAMFVDWASTTFLQNRAHADANVTWTEHQGTIVRLDEPRRGLGASRVRPGFARDQS